MANTNDSRSDRVFHDAIHGTMELPPLCVDIINTVQFQRLRNIKQLGLCYYVYPSASHNRFEHCLGTCYLAGKMIRHLKQQDSSLDITDRDILCVEIAGLCHDLGHAPFSHAFEGFINEKRGPHNEWKQEKASCKMLEHLLKENPHIKDKLETHEIYFIKKIIIGKGNKENPDIKDKLDDLKIEIDFLKDIIGEQEKEKPDIKDKLDVLIIEINSIKGIIIGEQGNENPDIRDKLDVLEIEIKFLKDIIIGEQEKKKPDIKDKLDVLEIEINSLKGIIIGEQEKENPDIKDKLDVLEIEINSIKDNLIGKRQKPNFFYQIVNNRTYKIDVDKWDYLARDSHFVGIGTSFDHERMMKMSKVIDGEICYRDKTLKNFYDMFYSRYRLHTTVYQHKTVLLLNKLLGEALNSADDYMNIFERVDKPETLTYFTDSILEEILKEKKENVEDAQNKLKDIINRKFVYKGVVTDTIKGKINGRLEKENSKKRDIDIEVEGTVSFEEKDTFREVIEDTEQNFQCTIVAGTKEKKTRKIEGRIYDAFTGRKGSTAKRTFEGKIDGIIFDTLYSKIEGDINGTIEETINSTDETFDQSSDKTCTASFDYGAKAENPLTKIPFYTKKKENQIMRYTPEKLESMLFLPNKFQMKIRHCFKMN